MCGIFGLVAGRESNLRRAEVEDLIGGLFRLSESRGREAAGLAVRHAGGLRIHKQGVSAGLMIRSGAYRGFLRDVLGSGPESELLLPLAVIGHSRLVTNGSRFRDDDNQPCVAESLVLVHNGIIVNDRELWERNPELERRGQVDSEVLLKLIGKYRGGDGNLAAGAARAFADIRGSASIALLDRDGGSLVLASNTGSLYSAGSAGLAVFASERFILAAALRLPALRHRMAKAIIRPLRPDTGRILVPGDGPDGDFPLGRPVFPSGAASPVSRPSAPARPDSGLTAGLRRCVRCILPETMPFIDFDAQGVCRYCRTYTSSQVAGREALERMLEPFRSRDGSPDCLVAFSGGRDSSYGLHYLKKEMGMNPVAFTYDWGMVTDLGRRNQARMCGQLGVEHILVSADIARKRGNIRKNVEAWLRKPHLGMIPLFMAGDKQFFHHANRLQARMGIKLVIFCESPLEKTHFKTGFLGVREGGGRLYDMPAAAKARLNLAYIREFLRNPAYLNRSLLDSAFAFGSAYLIRHDYRFLFRYIPWREDEIDRTLLGGYDWETSPDTVSTWRIGDGSAAFYNFIYHTVAGFTEFDTFHSNQIREGHIDREEALARIAEENLPRWPSMREYADLVGFDLDRAVEVIRSMPRLYGSR